jgi:hypothetical protein
MPRKNPENPSPCFLFFILERLMNFISARILQQSLVTFALFSFGLIASPSVGVVIVIDDFTSDTLIRLGQRR